MSNFSSYGARIESAVTRYGIIRLGYTDTTQTIVVERNETRGSTLSHHRQGFEKFSYPYDDSLSETAYDLLKGSYEYVLDEMAAFADRVG